MSGPLPCQNHPDRIAAVLMTNLETGDTLTICFDCMMDWAQMLVGGPEAVPEITQEELEATQEVAHLEPAQPAPDAEPKSEPQPAPTPAPRSKRRATPAQEAPAPGE